MRRSIASVVLAVAMLASFPAVAVNLDTGFHPSCSGGSSGVVCTDLFISSFDGTLLDATFYVPSTATTSNKAPAILMTHGYPGWHRSAGDFAFQQMLAAEGYVVLAYTSRGLGRSEGTIQLDSPDFEVKDAQHLITWLATTANTGNVVKRDSGHDPRVGMVGGSYAGAIQLLTAAYDDRLDAITPQITWNDLRYSLFPNGVVKRSWIDLLYHAGRYSGHLGPVGTFPPPVISTESVPADQDIQVLSSYLTNEDLSPPVPYSDGSANSAEYLERRSPVWGDVIDNITAPTLLIQGQQDTLFEVNEAIANYNDIADNGTDAKLVVFSGGHGYSDLAGERAAINDRILTWFDRYLWEDATVVTGDPIELWRPWVAGSNFGALSALPSASTDAGVSPTSATIANVVAPTSHTELSNFQQSSGSPAFDAAAPVTAFHFNGTTVGAGATVTIAGTPRLNFTISATTTEAIVFAKLWDQDTATGARTPIHRIVIPARIRGGGGDFCSDVLPGPISTSVVSGVNVCLPLGGMVWRLAGGHRLVLTLATSDTSFFSSRQPGVYQIENVSLMLPTTSAL